MHTEDELVEIFRAMNLDTSEKRERFMKMRQLLIKLGAEQSQFFIRISGGTSISNPEVQNAKLEGDLG